MRTDDDEVDLAYYFIDDEAAAASADRLDFLLNDAWPLPTGVSPGGTTFDHRVPVRAMRPARPGADAVFSVRLCWQHPGTDTNLDLEGALVFPGLSLPELAAHLRSIEDPDADGWPLDARLLRALVAPGDGDIGQALRCYAGLPGNDPVPGDVDQVELVSPEVVSRSPVSLAPHIAQVARYIDGFFGFAQWFLFDGRWAASHPQLARSPLRYVTHWDPYRA